jgi:hypothetical protein
VPEPRILLFDIETAPAVGYYFDPYKEGNIIEIKEDWYILSFAYKWLDEKAVHVRALPDFPLQKQPEMRPRHDGRSYAGARRQHDILD